VEDGTAGGKRTLGFKRVNSRKDGMGVTKPMATGRVERKRTKRRRPQGEAEDGGFQFEKHSVLAEGKEGKSWREKGSPGQS